MKYRMNGFNKLIIFLSIMIIAVYFMITGTFERKEKNETAVSANNHQKVQQADQPGSISPFTPQLVTYNLHNTIVWVKQRIFLSGGQIQPFSSQHDETVVYLYFLDDDQIVAIDLTAYALKYNLYEGIHYITASPSGRYIAAEFSSDMPISILIDTEDKTSRVLWYDEPKLISMMSISWNPSEENEFAFLPSVDIKGENGSHSVKIYHLNTQSSKSIGYIDMERISLQKSLIQWNNHEIKVIPTSNHMVTVFKFDINE